MLNEITFACSTDSCSYRIWEYQIKGCGHVMNGTISAESDEECFFKTMRMFLIGVGPQNVTLVFEHSQEHLANIMDDFINENMRFIHDYTKIHHIKFQNEFIHSLFNISLR